MLGPVSKVAGELSATDFEIKNLWTGIRAKVHATVHDLRSGR